MTAPVIKVNQVTKEVQTTEHSLTILKDISFQVEQGESIALIGVSGAGKSTLMTLLAGLDIPTLGEIELLGKSLGQLDDEERAALRAEHIGFVFQSFLLVPSLTAIENVLLPCTIHGEEEDEARAKELLDSVGLTGRENHLPAQLSGGEQQRVAIARAFMVKPKILFADEPTGNLDQQTAAKVIELLFALNRDHGTTLVLVTHDPSLAQRCNRTIRIDGGKVVQA